MMIYACEKNHDSIVYYLLQQPKYLYQDKHWDQAGFIVSISKLYDKNISYNIYL